MDNRDNGVGEVLERHRAFWRRDKAERPLLSVRLHRPLAHTAIPLADGTWTEGDLRLQPEMLDPAAFTAFGQGRSQPGSLLQGDAFSVRAPYVRIPWIEAVLGCPIYADRVSGSIWSAPFLAGADDWTGLAGWRNDGWLHKLQQFTRTLVEANDGSYLPVHTLMRGPIDLVRAVLGDTPMCLAIYDWPAAIGALLDATTDVFLEVAQAQREIIPSFQGGHSSPFGIWAPGTVVRTQCDMSALLSARTYADLVIPFEQKVCRLFDYSVIHLHSGYLHTVDALLEAELPSAIEIALDTGSTPVTTRDLVPICRKILQRKPLLLEGPMAAADLDYLLESLPGSGLYIRADLEAEELDGWKPPWG